MSRFSGKCDFCDIIEIYGLDRILKAKVTVGEKQLELKSIKDCIPYYPHIVSSSCCSNENGDYFNLTEKSWVDMEEEKYGYHPYYDIYRELLRKEIEEHEETE